MHGPVAQVLFQFQRWSVNAGRLATREYLMPLARAYQSGNPQAIGYHSLRALGFVVGAIGGGVLQQEFRSLVYGKNPNDPSFAEIGKQLMDGKFAQAFQWSMERAYGAVILGGLTGQLGNDLQIPENITHPGRKRSGLKTR
jgi:hypothetical protein